MRKYTPKTAAKTVIQLLVLAVALIATVAAKIYLSSYRILMITLVALFWVAAVIFAGIMLPVYFRRTVVYVSEAEISVHSGIVFLRREHMKADSMQYFSYVKTPLSNITGFNFITVHALGATVLLPFLSKKDAEEIAALFNAKIESK